MATELRALTPAVIQFDGYGNHTGSVEQHSAEVGSIIGSLVPSAWLGPLCYSMPGAVASREPWAAQLMVTVVRVEASYFWSVREVGDAS